jgi:hypothetical protein
MEGVFRNDQKLEAGSGQRTATAIWLFWLLAAGFWLPASSRTLKNAP